MDMLRYLAVKIRQETLVLPGTRTQTINDHKKIFEAVKNKDPAQAEKMMKKHIEKTIKNVKRIPKQRR
jgi:DNA-binding GntR family transcriptional regulator